MYIGRNSISCLKAFIDGWAFRDPANIVDESALGDFQDWIVDKYNITTAHSWCDIILFHSQDEADALSNFFVEFDDWREKQVRESEGR